MNTDSLKVGDEVVIRRTSGKSQIARVRWVERQPNLFYRPPEAIVFEVEFEEDGKNKVKGCRRDNLVDIL